MAYHGLKARRSESWKVNCVHATPWCMHYKPQCTQKTRARHLAFLNSRNSLSDESLCVQPVGKKTVTCKSSLPCVMSSPEACSRHPKLQYEHATRKQPKENRKLRTIRPELRLLGDFSSLLIPRPTRDVAADPASGIGKCGPHWLRNRPGATVAMDAT